MAMANPAAASAPAERTPTPMRRRCRVKDRSLERRPRRDLAGPAARRGRGGRPDSAVSLTFLVRRGAGPGSRECGLTAWDDRRRQERVAGHERSHIEQIERIVNTMDIGSGGP